MSLISAKSTVHTQIVFFLQPRAEMQANNLVCCLTIEMVMDSNAVGRTGCTEFTKKW